jgi:Domain of unknown function (DUF1906)
MSNLRKLEQELSASRDHAKALAREIEALQDQSNRVNHSIPLPRTGVDCSFSHPNYSKLKSAGISFVGRYLTGEGKALTRGEAIGISSEGLDIFALFETTGNRMSLGYSAGTFDAVQAKHALDDLKPKGNPPVYFACDFDAEGGSINQVLEYIRGAVHELGWHRVGIYGGLSVIARAHAENRCKFLYQTLAWSGGKWFPDAQLRQTGVGLDLLGASVDLDKAVSADFGQFRV